MQPFSQSLTEISFLAKQMKADIYQAATSGSLENLPIFLWTKKRREGNW